MASIMKCHLVPPAAPPPLSLESTLPPVPEHTPMTRYHLLHQAHTQLPTSILNLKHVTSTSNFRFILSDSVPSTIILGKNTNSYAQEKRDTTEVKGTRWSSIMVGHHKIWLGIVIYMGIFSAPALKDY